MSSALCRVLGEGELSADGWWLTYARHAAVESVRSALFFFGLYFSERVKALTHDGLPARLREQLGTAMTTKLALVGRGTNLLRASAYAYAATPAS